MLIYLALKHYTSKLSTYDDISSLQTFGFRGEALSSLCALSKFHIITARATDAPKGTKLEFEISGKLKGTSVVASQKGTTVVAENLFYNLPVRRKELEKTIKREYGKVLGLLHAYACISTGVKFSVSNQMPKGKKTVAFSTKSNPSTKENIANVYGAKTLLALIPLDLKFEMDSTMRPTQGAKSWGSQEDGSKEVRIQGHISRPVVGEGRQTPDRQMFFVNSRPCLLPQVAKAFNEVYKSYNVTQSPFIFADIKLDTNAYDVNVSPDKRTILLHDQTTLLESLKTSLTELFEAHDQSVPQNQLTNRKLPSYKPLTIRNNSTGQVTEVDSVPTDIATTTQLRVEALVRSSSDTSGIEEIQDDLNSKFASRNSADENPISGQRNHPSENQKIPGADETMERDEDEDHATNDPSRSPSPSLFVEEESPTQPPDVPLQGQKAKHLTRQDSSFSNSNEEESIPAIKQTPQPKSTQSTIQNAFDRMRPMRTPVQQATITVGNTTTVSTIGNSSRASKRARIHTPRFGFNGTPLSQTPKKPLLVQSLRGFVAPGTQAESDGEDVVEEDDGDATDDVDQDLSMPDAPSGTESSLPEKRRTVIVGWGSPGTSKHLEQCSDEDEPGSESASESVQEEEEGMENLNDEEDSDDEYIDDTEKKAREEAKIAKMIAAAEEAAARPSDDNIKRANRVLKGVRKKYPTLELVQSTKTSVDSIQQQLTALQNSLQEPESLFPNSPTSTQAELSLTSPEERLTLTVSKPDFTTMRIIGQFNLGFILAARPPNSHSPNGPATRHSNPTPTRSKDS